MWQYASRVMRSVGVFRNQYSVRRRYMKSRVAFEYFGIVSSEKALDLFAFAD